MASGTLIFRPSQDVNVAHSLNTGSEAYRLLAERTADDNSTYIYQTLSSTSSTSVSSVFVFTVDGSLPFYDYKITAVRLYARGVIGNNGETGSAVCYFAAGSMSGGSSTDASVSGDLSTSYATGSATSDSLVSDINNYIETNREFPIISAKVTTTGTKSSSKNASDGYIRITQIYAEFDYEDTVFEPPVEEPGVTYQSLTISSINASTTPANGTTRVVQGTNQTIEIIPTDSQLTLATDNGVDITSRLTKHTFSNTYTVTTQVSGASYGFPLNSSTGYYTSNNKGQGNSAAVCRVNFTFENDCAVTISYINYAQAQNDYGIFGNIDQALGTTYTADTNAFYRCNTSNDNSSQVRTLTYNIPAGSHFIDIKFRKNNQTNSNNDTLQWKISSIVSTGADSTYTYNLNNITEKHNLMFVFGQVTYYTITTNTTDCKAFPDGQVIVMPGNTYTVNIVPNNITDIIGISDNNTNMTSSLIKEKGVSSGGDTIASYSYELTNVQANHNLNIVGVPADSLLYLKLNGEWTVVLDAYYKENGTWVKKDLSFFSDIDMTYLKKGN